MLAEARESDVQTIFKISSFTCKFGSTLYTFTLSGFSLHRLNYSLVKIIMVEDETTVDAPAEEETVEDAEVEATEEVEETPEEAVEDETADETE